jgi:DNA-directed RNA polymerase specialized sigma24 family protein
MSTSRLGSMLGCLREATVRGNLNRLPDRELLDRFVARQDSAAFEVLIARYGPLVWKVCRRVLPELATAEDAFQATFLVLVHKAGSVRQGELLGNWLYGVAGRTASRPLNDGRARAGFPRDNHPTPSPRLRAASWSRC